MINESSLGLTGESLSSPRTPEVPKAAIRDGKGLQPKPPTAMTPKSPQLTEAEGRIERLTKQVFNLKLKIYHLEQRLTEQHPTDAVAVVQENVELRTKIEVKTRECHERSLLLVKARNALENLQMARELRDTKSLSETKLALKVAIEARAKGERDLAAEKVAHESTRAEVNRIRLQLEEESGLRMQQNEIIEKLQEKINREKAMRMEAGKSLASQKAAALREVESLHQKIKDQDTHLNSVDFDTRNLRIEMMKEKQLSANLRSKVEVEKRRRIDLEQELADIKNSLLAYAATDPSTPLSPGREKAPVGNFPRVETEDKQDQNNDDLRSIGFRESGDGEAASLSSPSKSKRRALMPRMYSNSSEELSVTRRGTKNSSSVDGGGTGIHDHVVGILATTKETTKAMRNRIRSLIAKVNVEIEAKAKLTKQLCIVEKNLHAKEELVASETKMREQLQGALRDAEQKKGELAEEVERVKKESDLTRKRLESKIAVREQNIVAIRLQTAEKVSEAEGLLEKLVDENKALQAKIVEAMQPQSEEVKKLEVENQRLAKLLKASQRDLFSMKRTARLLKNRGNELHRRLQLNAEKVVELERVGNARSEEAEQREDVLRGVRQQIFELYRQKEAANRRVRDLEAEAGSMSQKIRAQAARVEGTQLQTEDREKQLRGEITDAGRRYNECLARERVALADVSRLKSRIHELEMEMRKLREQKKLSDEKLEAEEGRRLQADERVQTAESRAHRLEAERNIAVSGHRSKKEEANLALQRAERSAASYKTEAQDARDKLRTVLQDVESKRVHAEDEIRTLNTKLLEAENEMSRYREEMEEVRKRTQAENSHDKKVAAIREVSFINERKSLLASIEELKEKLKQETSRCTQLSSQLSKMTTEATNHRIETDAARKGKRESSERAAQLSRDLEEERKNAVSWSQKCTAIEDALRKSRVDLESKVRDLSLVVERERTARAAATVELQNAQKHASQLSVELANSRRLSLDARSDAHRYKSSISSWSCLLKDICWAMHDTNISTLAAAKVKVPAVYAARSSDSSGGEVSFFMKLVDETKDGELTEGLRSKAVAWIRSQLQAICTVHQAFMETLGELEGQWRTHFVDLNEQVERLAHDLASLSKCMAVAGLSQVPNVPSLSKPDSKALRLADLNQKLLLQIEEADRKFEGVGASMEKLQKENAALSKELRQKEGSLSLALGRALQLSSEVRGSNTGGTRGSRSDQKI